MHRQTSKLMQVDNVKYAEVMKGSDEFPLQVRAAHGAGCPCVKLKVA
jgi:hypothetical protein